MPIDRLKINDHDEMPLDRKQIYIVDDDQSVCRSLRLLMTSYGFAVDTYASAEDFFSAVPNSVPGCLILDIHMSGLNGWSAMQRLTDRGSKRPVIVISADMSESFKERALKAGAVGFLQKPFEDHYLLHMVDRVFNKTEYSLKGSKGENVKTSS